MKDGVCLTRLEPETVGSQIGKHTHDLFSCVSLGKYVKELLMHTQQTYVH